ncbi:MAG: DUF6020 family protein [Anaerostipes sp.]|nr:DUF6020 family protein [Anaerostipes sp.]
MIIKKLPGIDLLFSTGFYTWIVLIMMMFHVSKRDFKGIVIYIPCLMVVASCVLSPQNGNVRYMKPVMLVIWIVVAAGIGYLEKNKITQND